MSLKSPDKSLLDGLHVHPLDASTVIQVQKWLAKMLLQQLPCMIGDLQHQVGSAVQLVSYTFSAQHSMGGHSPFSPSSTAQSSSRAAQQGCREEHRSIHSCRCWEPQ